MVNLRYKSRAYSLSKARVDVLIFGGGGGLYSEVNLYPRVGGVGAYSRRFTAYEKCCN